MGWAGLLQLAWNFGHTFATSLRHALSFSLVVSGIDVPQVESRSVTQTPTSPSHSEEVVYAEKHLSRAASAGATNPVASISEMASRSVCVKSLMSVIVGRPCNKLAFAVS